MSKTYLLGLILPLLMSSSSWGQSEEAIELDKKAEFDFPYNAIEIIEADDSCLIATISNGGSSSSKTKLIRYNYLAGKATWEKTMSAPDVKVHEDELLFSFKGKVISIDKVTGKKNWGFERQIKMIDEKNGIMLNNSFQAFDLNSGFQTRRGITKGVYEWKDHEYINDSVIVAAAGGLHWYNLSSGESKTIEGITGPMLTQSSSNAAGAAAMGAAFGLIGGLIYAGAAALVPNSTGGVHTTMTTCSNILIQDKKVFFSSRKKLGCYSEEADILWETSIDHRQSSFQSIEILGDHLYLVNHGFYYNPQGNKITKGQAYVAKYDLQGKLIKKIETAKIHDYSLEKTDLVLLLKKGILTLDPNTLGVKFNAQVVLKGTSLFKEFSDCDEYVFYAPEKRFFCSEQDEGKDLLLIKGAKSSQGEDVFYLYNKEEMKLFQVNTYMHFKVVQPREDGSKIVSNETEDFYLNQSLTPKLKFKSNGVQWGKLNNNLITIRNKKLLFFDVAE